MKSKAFWSSGGFKSRGFNPQKQRKTIVLTIRSLDRSLDLNLAYKTPSRSPLVRGRIVNV